MKEVKRDSATLAHVILVDEHGHERTVRVTPNSVDEVEQDVLIPVSDEIETLARNAVGPMAVDPVSTMSAEELAEMAADVVPRPMVGARGSGEFDPKATLPASASVRPHIGTGEVPLPEVGTATDEFDSLEDLAAEEERVSKPHVGTASRLPKDPNVTQKLPVAEILSDDDD